MMPFSAKNWLKLAKVYTKYNKKKIQNIVMKMLSISSREARKSIYHLWKYVFFASLRE